MKKNRSIQSLRALAFLGIFLCHVGTKVAWAELGVSIFFVISGFLLSNRDLKFNPSIKNNALFSFKKIMKLYPLHIITMFAVLMLYLSFDMDKGELLRDTVLNILLIQCWYPSSDVNVSLNGVAWFLSAISFLYFMYPWLNRWLKNVSEKVKMLVPIAVLAIQILACIPVYILDGENSLYVWFMYCFPVFRLGDFIVGLILGEWYKEEKVSVLKKNSAITVIVGILLTAGFLFWMKKTSDSMLLIVLKNWTSLNILFAAMWVLIFVSCTVPRILDNRVLQFMGDISSYIFLIHFVVIKYWRHLGLNLPFYATIGIEMVISVILSCLWKWADEKIYSFRREMK
ncbi:MAG: acyltransferase [Butyrivibrio sp.]|nr:acyltransferase [Butyrivibrio sp.]